jgi:hypothetical protein
MAEELNVDRTPGFKVGEKKTIDEYQKLGKPAYCRRAKLTVDNPESVSFISE